MNVLIIVKNPYININNSILIKLYHINHLHKLIFYAKRIIKQIKTKGIKKTTESNLSNTPP